jgi:transcriptional regulator with XRE-family HTH domain
MALDSVAFGKRVKEARVEIKLTQEKMAKMLSISVSHVRHIESGNRVPGLRMFAEMCDISHVSPGRLMQDSVGKTERDELKMLDEQMKSMNAKYLKLTTDMVSVIAEFSNNDR